MELQGLFVGQAGLVGDLCAIRWVATPVSVYGVVCFLYPKAGHHMKSSFSISLVGNA